MNNKSTHILSTSSNLLGLSLVVLTSLKISNYSEHSLIDEFTGMMAVLLSISTILSFLSLRDSNIHGSNKFEQVADICFVLALVLMVMIIILVSLNIIF